MKEKILNFTAAFLLIVSAFLTLVGCTGVTSAGVNRSLLYQETQVVPLPYTVTVDEKSRAMECKTEAYRAPIPMSFMFLMGGLGGIAGGKAAERSGLLPDLTRMRGTFLAGEAFTEAVKRISAPTEETHPVLQLTLLRFQPAFSMEAMNKNRRLAANIEFLAAFSDNRVAAHSAYVCEYKVGKNEVFSSQDEKDLLREMMDLSIMHWAKQLSLMPATISQPPRFPKDQQGQIVYEGGQCSYQIFAQHSPAAEQDSANPMVSPLPNEQRQHGEEDVK